MDSPMWPADQVPQAPLPSDRAVMAIDLGATYSGIAFARPGQTLPTVFRAWPDGGSNTKKPSAKVPTMLGVKPDKNFSWGYRVSSENELLLNLFKLILVHQDYLPETVRTSPLYQAMCHRSAELRMSAIEITSAYLKELWHHFIDSEGFSDEELQWMQIVITIPANWPQSVRADIIRALHDAGILDPSCGRHFFFLWEPQAAAQAMIRDFSQIEHLKEGEMLVVCDAGGVTVDCATYKVASTSPKLRLEEVVESAGRFYGVALTKTSFLDLLKAKMASAGVQQDAIAAVPDAELEQFAEKNWDHRIMRMYPFKTFYVVKIPSHWGGQSRTIRFLQAEVIDLLTPPVRDVCDLVEAQVEAAFASTQRTRLPGYVLVCGGFGSHGHLWAALEARLARVPGPTEIRWYEEGDQGWSAVSRGAVIAAREAENLPGAPVVAAADYHIVRSDGETRTFINQGKRLRPGYRIPLYPEDFIVVSYTLDVNGNPPEEIARLVVGRRPAGPPSSDDGSRRPLELVFEVTSYVGVDSVELQVLGDSNSRAGLELAVGQWRPSKPGRGARRLYR